MAFASEISGPNLEGRWNRTKFKYDAFGYRVRSVTAGGDRRYFLDGQHLDSVFDPQGNPQSKYLRGTVIDEVVNAYHFDANGNATSYTYHPDALQSVVGLSGHAGSVEETYRYGPFGDLLSAPGTTPNRMQFTGREFDSETGLYYYRARYYDPEIGRFLSEDPLGFGGGDANLYAYVGNNPIDRTDPLGLRSLTFGEKALISPYFSDSVLSEVDVDDGFWPNLTGRAWSPSGNKIRVPSDFFIDQDSGKNLRLDDPEVIAYVAHEILHTWQRKQGRWVTVEGFFLQAANILTIGIYNPHAYDIEPSRPTELLGRFTNAHIEQQGQMYKDFELETPNVHSKSD